MDNIHVNKEDEGMCETPQQPVKGKRGRRSKKEIEHAKSLLQYKENTDGENTIVVMEMKAENEIVKPPPKKRGRKPKGGKIVQQTIVMAPKKEEKPNIILHLKCSIKDLDENSEFNMKNNTIESFTFENSKKDFLYEVIDNEDKYQPLLSYYNPTENVNNIFFHSYIIFHLKSITF